MLARMWRNFNSCTLLVGMWIGTTTIENSMEIPQKTKNRTTIWSSNSIPGYIYLKKQNINLKRYMHPVCIAAFCTIAKIQKQPKCPTGKWIKKMWLYIYVYIYMYMYTHNEMKEKSHSFIKANNKCGKNNKILKMLYWLLS